MRRNHRASDRRPAAHFVRHLALEERPVLEVAVEGAAFHHHAPWTIVVAGHAVTTWSSHGV